MPELSLLSSHVAYSRLPASFPALPLWNGGVIAAAVSVLGIGISHLCLYLFSSVRLSLPPPPSLGLKMPTWVECPFTGWVKIILISGILKTLRSFYVPSGFHSCHVELFRIIFFKESSQQRAQCTVSLAVSRTPRLPFWLQSHRSSPSEYFTSNPLHSASVPLLDWFEVFFFFFCIVSVPQAEGI